MIATGIASALSGFSAAALGYSGHFLLATVLAVAAPIAVARLWPEPGRTARVASDLPEVMSCA